MLQEQNNHAQPKQPRKSPSVLTVNKYEYIVAHMILHFSWMYHLQSIPDESIPDAT